MNSTFDQAMRPQAVFRQCFGCNYEAVTVAANCPRCGKKKFFTSKNIRIRGGIVIASGLFIAGLIGAVAVFVGIMLVGAANDPSSSRRLAENELTLLAIYGFFALLICMGLYFVATGTWMVAFGKRNRIMVWFMWVLIGVVFGVGGIISALT